MPSSMTGFARAEEKHDWGTITCELKTVNHRYLDIYFRLPDTLRSTEMEFRTQIKAALSRGKLECAMQIQMSPEQTDEVAIDIAAAKSIITSYETISELMPSTQSPSPLDILKFPGVLASNAVDEDQLHGAATAALDAALSKLAEIRNREGADMAAIVQRRVESMYEQLNLVEAAFPNIKLALETRLRERLAELKTEMDSDRLEQELVMLAQKMDVDEEMDRLRTHLDEVARVLKSDKPIGRRLDFLMQELNREANTLSSKSQGIETTNVAVEMKVLIEQMREQIQNIE